MSLRTRLVLAFFLLSVVPLAAVTTYSYVTNVEALRVAAEREADLLAGELGQRMQLVTAQLSERVEHLMDIAELQAAADSAAQSASTTPAASTTSASAASTQKPVTLITATPATGVTVSQLTLSDQIARSLGQTAMLLNNVQMRNTRGGGGSGGRGGDGRGGGRGTPPGVVPPPPPVTTVGRAIPTSPVQTATATTPTPSPTPSATPATASDPRGRTGRPNQGTGGSRTFDAQRSGGSGRGPGAPPPPSAGQQGANAPPPGTPPQAGAQGPPAINQATVTPVMDANGNLMIDMGPLRRDLFRQVLPPDKRFEDLTQEERQRYAAEVNQRLLGIQQGIQISAAELQKRAIEAEKAAAARAEAAKADAAAQQKSAQPKGAVKTSTAPPAEVKRRSTLSGKTIEVNVEQNGEVVRSMNAEINLNNVLALVFSTSSRDRGELPFAVSKDGTVYARTEEDKKQVAAFGAVAKPDGPNMVRLRDWIVVTTEDKSGSGLKLGVARPVGDSLASLRGVTARNAGLGLLVIVVALVGMVPLSSRLTRNLSSLSDGVSRIAHGDYGARVPVRSKDEVGQLAVAFNQMASDVERHQKTAVEQERIRRELELGRQIQNEMLPHKPLNLGLTQVQGVSVPAREVGGDFFNYFVLDDGKIALLMGDVSGKGVGAALLMANIQASLRIRLGLGQTLAAVADALDRDIEASSPGPVYATLFIGVLDPANRVLRYVNAGHNPQYILRRQGGLQRMHATGLPVGLIAGRGYTEQSAQLAAGDLLVFYTDGCVEAENDRGEMFGVERLEPLLLASVQSADPLHRIESNIAEFRGLSEPLDDATLMTVKVG